MLGDRSILRQIMACLAAAGLACAAYARSDGRVAVKRLFAPPEAVLGGSLRLPGPLAGAVASRVAMLRFDAAGDAAPFEHGGGTVRVLPIASPGTEGHLVFAGDEGTAKIAVALDPIGLAADASVSAFRLPAGHRSIRSDADGAVFLAIADESDAALVASRATTLIRAGEPLVVRVEARRPAAAPPLADLGFAGRALAGAALPFTVDRAEVRFSDGSVAEGALGPGPEGSTLVAFPAAIAGDAVVEISATVRDGRAVRSRGVALLTRVARPGTRLADRPSLNPVAEGRWLELALPVVSQETAVIAAAELWAIGPRAERPLGWIGGVAEIEEDETLGPTVRLGLFPSRLGLAPGERLEAREVRFHERDGLATLEHRERIDVEVGPGVPEAIRSAAGAPSETDWMGLPGAATVAAPSVATLVPGPGSHVHALVHGYCASANPWPAGPFGPDAWVHEDLAQNRSNDQFALELLARSQDYKSFGVIGHSQGGMAALHLHTFYFSGLDWAGPGRLIQAVGTPFEGTPIAGVLAALGAVFGVQCGANYDLTPEGAAIWLSTIPPAARAKVFTFTTSYTGPGWSGYCSLATSFFLAFPEDGVTEHAAGHFPGANDLGLTYGWCHVGGMRDPAQSLDAVRNAAMRTAGAR